MTEPGSKLGHYEIIDQVGKGGMGEVYRARDTKLGREVAIKVLPAEFSKDEERLARLEREARMLAALNHPNIAAIYGLEQSDGTRFLVLELVEGDTLADRLQHGPIPLEEALKLASQIAEALEAAHEKGVIHRDLKPANIKVTPEGRVKVLDFGLAKAFIGDRGDVNLSNSPTLSMQATEAGIILGTAAYMSPEQARGRTVDKRSDIWAFGVVLYEMLTGRQPFADEDVSMTLSKVLQREPEFDLFTTEIPERVTRVLKLCLQKDPKLRIGDSHDVRLALEGAFDAPAAAPEKAIGAGGQGESRLRWVVVIAATALLAGGAVWALRPGTEPGPVVRFPFVLPGDQTFSRPELPMVTISSDGTRIAYAANGQIYVRNLAETQSRPIDGANSSGLGVSQPVFSPDGEWLAYVEALNVSESILKRVPVSGGTPVTLFDKGFQVAPSWPTPDTIVFAYQGGIVRIPANGGTAEVLVAAGPDEVFDSPQILPGGDAVLFSRAGAAPSARVFGNDAQIFVQTIGADDRTLVFDGGEAPRFLPTGHLVYAQGNTLFAIPFDPDSRTVSGGPVPIVEGVRRSSNRLSDTANFAVSDTGTLVVVPGTAGDTPETTLMLVDRKGGVSPLDVPPANYHSPRVSPDGTEVAVEIIDPSGQGQVWIYELSGDSAIRRLTQTGDNTRPIWTPDGERVTFGSEREGGWGIWERSADGSTIAERLTTADQNRRHFPDSWSPDGDTLAYTDADLANAQWDLWTYNRTSGTSELFSGGEQNQFSAVFSPDGRWLAYTSQTPVFGIYVQPFPQTGAVFQITDQSEAAPVWTADGRELFFRPQSTAASEPAQIMGMEVSAAGGITFRNRQTLPISGALMANGYRDFDITPDGRRFVMVYPAEGEDTGPAPSNQIDVVVNWTQELLERVPVD